MDNPINHDNPFLPFPTLSTERLTLRALTLADAPAYFEVHGDERAKRYTGSHPDRTLADVESRIRKIAEAIERAEGIRWAITLKSDGALVGSCGLWRWLKPHFRAELGYEQNPRYWGRGYMTEALAAIIDWGFANMSLHSIEANVDPDNLPSIRVLERLHFTKEGHMRENFYFDGKFYDTVVYSLLKPR